MLGYIVTSWKNGHLSVLLLPSNSTNLRDSTRPFPDVRCCLDLKLLDLSEEAVLVRLWWPGLMSPISRLAPPLTDCPRL